MKKGWEIRRLPEIAEYFIGLTYSPKDVGSEGTIVLRSSNVQNDELDLSDLVRVTCSVKKPLHVRKGDILMCSRNGSKRLVGKTAVIGDLPEEMTFGTFMTVIRSELNPYLSWFFRSEAFRDQIGVGENTMINQITKYMLDAIRVPVPPLAEQQRIVGLLDEAFEGLATAKASAEKNLQNAHALFESHLQSVFTQRGPGWVEKPFEECIEDVKYSTKIQRKEFLDEGKLPIVSQEAEFTNGYWDSAADVFKVTRPIVVFGDHTQVLKYIDFDFVLGADGVKLLLPKPFLNPKFFFYALRSAPLKSLGYARHYRLLKELQIGYPDMDTQVTLAKRLDALEAETQRLARLYERKLAALEALKKSLLHEAFSGRL